MERNILSLLRRRLTEKAVFSPSGAFTYQHRKMATVQEPPPSQLVLDEQNSVNRNSTSNTASRSLTDIARSKSAFKWTRPLPTFIATSSRGSIPHLTPDHIDLHSNISYVHIGLEDFITIPAQKTALLSIPIPLQQYLAYPEKATLVFSARRANPVPINSSWDNKIELNTIQGQTSLPVELFVNTIRQVGLREQDIVISLPDVTETPGVKRMTKMVERTQRWLKMLLNSNVQLTASLFCWTKLIYSLVVKFMHRYHRFHQPGDRRCWIITWTFLLRMQVISVGLLYITSSPIIR